MSEWEWLTWNTSEIVFALWKLARGYPLILCPEYFPILLLGTLLLNMVLGILP